MKLLIDIILLAAISLTAIILFVALNKKKNNLQHWLFISIFLMLFFKLLSAYGVFNQIGWLLYLAIFTQGIIYLLAPLIYLYFKSLAFKSDGFTMKHSLHFLPFMLYFIVLSIPFIISALKKEFIFSYLSFIDGHSYLTNVIEVIFVLCYLALSLWLLFKMKTASKNEFSTLTYKNIKWIELFVYGVLLSTLVKIVNLIFEITRGSSAILDMLLIISYVTLICYLGFFGLRQADTALKLEKKDNSTIEDNTTI